MIPGVLPSVGPVLSLQGGPASPHLWSITMTVYVYVIGRPDGPVKVGVAAAPWQRIKKLRTGCPFPVEILFVHPMRDRAHAMQHEGMFHSVHEQSRMHGEWFDMPAELAVESIETTICYENDKVGPWGEWRT